MKKLNSDTKKPKRCESCDVEFTPFPYKYDTARFCSRGCYLKDHHKKTRVCQGCGTEYIHTSSVNQIYCTRECWVIYAEKPPLPKMTKRGEEHPGVRKRMEQLNKTWAEYNNWLDSKKRYYQEVWRITNQQELSKLENADKVRGLAGTPGAYQLDHKISIGEGWNNKINPYIIGNIQNLRFITWEENLKRRK